MWACDAAGETVTLLVVTTLETLLEPLRHSPLLPEAVARLQRQMDEERERRERFYEEMTPDQKIEFIDGEVILHSPARNRHLDVTLMLAKLLSTYVSIHQLGEVKMEKCLVVFPRNDYEPDVVFFSNEKVNFVDDTMKFPVPDLVVEVLSKSTEGRDRGVKFEDYAANGVGEYWIVNAMASVLEQYVLSDAGYELRLKSGSGKLASEVVAGFEVELAAFFDEAKNLAALRSLLAAGQ